LRVAPHGGENCPYIPTFVVFLFVGLWVDLFKEIRIKNENII